MDHHSFGTDDHGALGDFNVEEVHQIVAPLDLGPRVFLTAASLIALCGGALLGCAALAAMARAMGEGSLVNAPPLPGRIALVMATLAGVGIGAGILPVVRAARVDPAVSLRAT